LSNLPAPFMFILSLFLGGERRHGRGTDELAGGSAVSRDRAL
jgi:hypothetical protein